MSALSPLSLHASLEVLPLIREFVGKAAKEAGLNKTLTYNLQLAVDEFATNIVVHGYRESGLSGDIVVRGEVTDTSLVITLEDQAAEFDPRQRKLPDEEDLSRPLEERPIGGLGIMLALKGVDRFDYRREGGRNFNIFEVHRPGHSAPSGEER